MALWGWGAIAGTGAAVIAGFFTGGATWGLLAVGAAGAAAGAGGGALMSAGGKTLGSLLGDNGVPKERQYQDFQKWQKDASDYMKEKADELFTDSRNRIKALQEDNKKIQTRIVTEQLTPADKAKLEAQIDRNNNEISQLNDGISKQMDSLNKAFEKFGKERMTMSEFASKSNKLDWSVWTNYGLLFIAVMVFFMLLGVIKSFFSKLKTTVTNF